MRKPRRGIPYPNPISIRGIQSGLYARAKGRAAEEGYTIGEFINMALRNELKRERNWEQKEHDASL